MRRPPQDRSVMPPLEPAAYKLFDFMVTDLEPIADQLHDNEAEFVHNQADRNRQYGSHVLVSQRQMNWLIDIHARNIGNIGDYSDAKRGPED